MNNYSIFITLCVLLFVPTAHASGLLVSWDDWEGVVSPSQIDADFAEVGLSASILYASNRVNASYGSNDGSFGNLLGASPAAGGLLVRALNSGKSPGGPDLAVRLKNESSFAYRIDSLHFDFSARSRPKKNAEHGFTGFDIVYSSGDLEDAGTLIGTAADLVLHDGGKTYDYPDFDIILSEQLRDTILEVGQSAVFLISFNGESEADVSSGIDNVAFKGSKVDIPEPSSCVMLASLWGFACAARRRAT